MKEPVIRVEGLGKKYRIGVREAQPQTVRQAVWSALSSPFSYLRQMRRPPAENETLWALKNISFEVETGEVVGIIGRNGAGKSTLLKILSRITDPTEGRAVMHGRVGSLLEVGTGFHPDLTGRENIYLSGTILGMKKREIDRKLDEIIAFAEVERFLDTPIKRYSSGMSVRLGFAVAAHLEPEILIVDEVLAVGDASFQKKCLGKMTEVAQEGRTILFVSHNMPTILRLCAKGILLEQGQILAAGAMSDVLSEYLTRVIGNKQQRVWNDLSTAPGSDQVRLVAVRIVNARGEEVSNISIEEPLQISYRYYVPKTNLAFRCVANVFTQGTLAFSSMETSEIIRSEPGYYESSVLIPGNLLAEGDYTIDVSIFSSRGLKVRHVYLSEALTIHIFDPLSGESARGDYVERYGGVLRPRLPWSLSYLGLTLTNNGNNRHAPSQRITHKQT